jgi:hypothetical protein
LVACGDDDGDSAESGAGGTAGSGGTTGVGSPLLERLGDCPLISQTSDPTAASCLVGRYEGTTPSGAACSLELGEEGAYEFESPTLNVSHTSPDETIFVYGRSSLSGYEQVVWKVSDPLSLETWYELSFEARYGTGVAEADSKIEIEVTEHAEDSLDSAVCVVNL